MCLCGFLHLNKGIPTLVILDSDCNLITTGGRGAVMADADGSVRYIRNTISCTCQLVLVESP